MVALVASAAFAVVAEQRRRDLALLRAVGATDRQLVAPSPAVAGSWAGAITNRIDRLVAKDLVTRDLDPANRRAVIIALTTKGCRLIDKAVVAHLDNEQRLLAHLSAEDQERLAPHCCATS